MKRILKPIVASFAIASVSHGAITWNTPQNIANDVSQISTNGTAVYAYNFTTATGSTSVNGVTFNNVNTFSVTGTYSFDFLAPSTGRAASADSGFGSGLIAGMDSGYRSLLSESIRSTGGSGSGVANDAAYNAYSLTLNGLTVGNFYEVQIWINDSRSLAPAINGIGTLDRGLGGPQVDYNVGDLAGNMGQYVTGTFQATSTSEFFIFDNYAAATSNVALLNAFQVRVIPEPSSALIAAAGLLMGIARRRR